MRTAIMYGMPPLTEEDKWKSMTKENIHEFDIEGALTTKEEDPVNPNHYKKHPSGIECIQVTEHMSFCVGNAVKYLWRADLKGNRLEDLKKARWYIDREISRLT